MKDKKQRVTPAFILSLMLTLAMFYAVMTDIDFANGKTVIGKIGDILTALIVHIVMTQWMVFVLFPHVYETVKKYVK